MSIESLAQKSASKTIHSGGPRLSRTDGVYSIRCCQFEAMVAGAGARPTEGKSRAGSSCSKSIRCEPAQNVTTTPSSRGTRRREGESKGSGSVILSLRRIWFFKFIRRLGHRARRVSRC
jgi:hypothetical protein